MNIVEQSWEWVKKPDGALELIETSGRTCYKSEHKIGPGSADKFASMLIKSGHHSVIEHAVASVRFITNRGVTHELVRHRLASYSQESTRYVRYGNMDFIRPVWWDKWSEAQRELWIKAMEESELAYGKLLDSGSRPEQAREVLPNSLKTEIVMTANLREWRHVFSLRCSNASHPQIRYLMLDCLKGFYNQLPVLFQDLADRFQLTT